MAPRKRKQSSSDYYVGRDRLSEMPDEVIVHILSFMPTLRAVRTMLLRRFGDLWTLLPTLRFVADVFDDHTSDDAWWFCIYVRNLLKFHRRPFIDKIKVYIDVDFDDDVKREASDDMSMWLSSTASNIPIFIGQSLVKLKLSCCTIDPQLEVNLGSLRELMFECVSICDKAFQQFICGCPSLQELSLDHVYELMNLRFSAPNMRKLSICEIHNASVDPWLFDFPNLKCLDLRVNWIPDMIDVSSVRDVYFEWFIYSRVDDVIEHKMWKMFLKKLSCSEVFRSSNDASEALLHVMDDLQLSQIRWKRVVLDLLVFCDSCLRGIYELTRSLKHLDELIIYIKPTYINQGNHNYDSLSLEDFFPCEISKLKIVVIHEYEEPLNRELQLIEFLLKSTPALEKLVIVTSKHQLRAIKSSNLLSTCQPFKGHHQLQG